MSLLSVIVACRNEREHIEACVRSIFAQETGPHALEIIVADGLSDDGTREILARIAQSDSRLRVVENPERITPTGLNRAILASKGEVILRMDAHTEYAPDYVATCVRVLEETGATNVGGPARTRASGYWQRAISAAYHSPFSTGGSRFHDEAYEGPIDTVPYGCWRRAFFDTFGLFDEELVRNQDDELNLRTVRGGGRVWQSSQIRSWYSPRSSIRTLFRQYRQYGYWKIRVIQKHRLPASPRHLVPAGFVVLVGGLGITAIVAPPLGVVPLGVVLGAYGCGLAAFSVVTAQKRGWDLTPALPLVFATYHLSYGVGSLQGVVDFLLLRRGPRASQTQVTRSATTETK